MADASRSAFVTTSEHQEEAATQALLRFQDSVENVLKYTHVYIGAAETKNTLLRMQAEIQEKNTKIQQLESAISVFTNEGNKEVLRMKEEVAEKARTTSDLDKRLQQVSGQKIEADVQIEDAQRLLAKQEKTAVHCQKELNVLRAEDKTLRAILENETAAKNDLARQLKAVSMQLDVYNGYTADLINLKATTFSKSVARIWGNTASLVKKYFSPDLSAEQFESHDQWTQQACSFLRPPAGSLLIPLTNSPAAKYARQAVMLNVVALALSRWIFTATPLPLAESGLDDILVGMMDQDPDKELLFRALLCSEFATQEKEVQGLAKWMIEAFGTLLTPKARNDMKADLRKFFEEATKCWAEARRSRQKVVATFDYESYPDDWESYSAPSQRHKQNAKHTQASDPEDEDELALIAFPAIIVMSGESHETIHHGVLVRYSHMYEAEVEWRKEQKKRRFSRSGVPHNLIGPPSFE